MRRSTIAALPEGAPDSDSEDELGKAGEWRPEHDMPELVDTLKLSALEDEVRRIAAQVAVLTDLNNSLNTDIDVLAAEWRDVRGNLPHLGRVPKGGDDE